jgi:hypothetical protein
VSVSRHSGRVPRSMFGERELAVDV